MENQRLDRYVGDYDKFQEVYSVKKAQLEAAYKRQQQKSLNWKISCQKQSPRFHQKYGYVPSEETG